eukprot:TRINITY_DN1926_c0_g1_i1.p1 TRINITY_DN1926_c0_g1~~TRINITY_DN1926_c0_g1_i1.p1  ORF type:complete len:244 (-),score=66.36 TRINITY_DN1926_c0_g1_i1:35-766(-)
MSRLHAHRHKVQNYIIQRKLGVSLVLSIICFVFTLISLASPWFYFRIINIILSIDGSIKTEISVVKYYIVGNDAVVGKVSDYEDFKEMKPVFGIVAGFTILGEALALLTMIFSIFDYKNKPINQRVESKRGYLHLAGAIALSLAAISFPLGIINQSELYSFSDRLEVQGNITVYGPAAGWYFATFGAFITILHLLIGVFTPPNTEPKLIEETMIEESPFLHTIDEDEVSESEDAPPSDQNVVV